MSVRHIVHERLIPGQSGDGISPPEAAIIRNQIDTMPTVIAGNYTKRLANYESLAAAIADLPNAGADGGEIQVDGEISLTGQIAPPPNVHLIGRGAGSTILRGPSGINAPLLTLDGASGAVVADLSLLPPEDASHGTSSRAISIIGDTDDVTVERVTASGFAMNVRVEGAEGTTPGTVRNLALNGVRADNATGSYGFNLSNVDGVVLSHCTGNYNWLDGLKFTAQTRNVKDVGGTYNHNGQSYIGGGGSAGDGIDAFAGGDTFTLIGTTCDYNNGNGITIKTDSLTGTDPGTFGYVRNVQIVNVTCRHNNPGNGMTFYSLNYPTPTPHIQKGVMTGGHFEGNKLRGLWVDGMTFTAIGPMAIRNGREGIMVDEHSLFVSLVDPTVIANSQDSAGTYHGIDLNGSHIALRGGTILGVDDDTIHAEADLAALTKYHKRNVYVQPTARDVYVDVDFEDYSVDAGSGIHINATGGPAVQQTFDTISPRGLTQGGPGSWFVNTEATNEADVYWVRRNVALPPNSTQGWKRLSGLPVVTSLPAAADHSEGDMVMLKSGGVAPGTVHICVNTTGNTYAWKQVTLT